MQYIIHVYRDCRGVQGVHPGDAAAFEAACGAAFGALETSVSESAPKITPIVQIFGCLSIIPLRVWGVNQRKIYPFSPYMHFGVITSLHIYGKASLGQDSGKRNRECPSHL